MALTLYYHPLSNFCQKVLVALYESGVEFTPEFIDLGNEAHRARRATISASRTAPPRRRCTTPTASWPSASTATWPPTSTA